MSQRSGTRQGYRNTFWWRIYDEAAQAADRAFGWDKLPQVLGLLVLIGLRNILRQRNLYDTSSLPSAVTPKMPDPGPERLTTRTPNGAYNDLGHPAMGMAGTRFSIVYPRGFRLAWPIPPALPPQLARPDADVLAELAVCAPFGSYLRRAGSDSGENTYELDLRWVNGYQVRESLARPGGRALFAVRDGRLETAAIHPDHVPTELARGALLAGLNEDLTTFRHNLSVHLTMLTSFAIATTNELNARHPVRRLLHHCFHTVLIGNREIAEFQLAGARGYSATIFSHGAAELLRMADDHVSRFDFWGFEPDTQFRNRGTTQTPFDYPYRDNILRLWAETAAYVKDYLGLYYQGDDSVRDDAELARWARELDRLVPNGVTLPGGDITFEWLARVSATLIHVSTVEHDVLNNIVWNYSTLGWIVPTVVPLSGETMDQRRAFDLIATIIGTWKPYNMLLTANVPALALDERAAVAMQKWIERLGKIQANMASGPVEPDRQPDLSLSYPANLNVSISN